MAAAPCADCRVRSGCVCAYVNYENDKAAVSMHVRSVCEYMYMMNVNVSQELQKS